MIESMADDPTDLISRLLLATHRLARIAAIATGITTPAAIWRTLGILQTDGPLRVGELARISHVSQPTITKLLRHLAESGLVSRTPDPTDSRATLVGLTAAGVVALEDWRVKVSSALSPLFSGLSDGDISTLEKAVRILEYRAGSGSIVERIAEIETRQKHR